MNWKHFPRRSLKTRVTLFTLAIFLAGIWSLAFYASRTLREDMRQLLSDQQYSTISALAAQVNMELDERLQALDSVAVRIGPSLEGNATAIQALLEQLPIFQRLFNAGSFAVGFDGTAIASIPVGQAGVNYMNTDYIATVLKEGRAMIGQPVLSKQLRSPLFGMAVPIRGAQGRVIGALIGSIDLGKPSSLDTIARSRHGRSGDYLLVAPQQRMLIIASDKSRAMEPLPAPGAIPALDRFLQGHEGTSLYADSLGVEVLASAKAIPAAGWIVTAILPTAEAFAPIRALQQRILIATILLTVLAGSLTWWMLRRQLAPMLAATKALAALPTGHRVQPLPNSSQDEVGELIASFNRLLRSLEQRETALRASEERLRTLIDWSIEAIAVHRDGKLIYVNPSAIKMIGARTAQDLIGTPVLDRVHPDCRQIALARIKSVADTGVATPLIEEKFLKLDGTVIDVEVQSRRILYDGAIQVALRDCTAQKQVERALRQREERYRVLAEASHDIIVLINDKLELEYTNAFAARQFNRDPEHLIGKRVSDIFPPQIAARQEHNLRKVFASGQSLYVEAPSAFPGHLLWLGSWLAPIKDPAGKTTAILVVSRDLTERKRLEEQMREMAFHDTLTRLPNRRLLNDRLSQAIAASRRSGLFGAVIFLDLDNFKLLNDTHGHEVGDQLLAEAADRLKACVREMDTVARFGGDEFVVMISELDGDQSESRAQAGMVAEKIRAALAKPYVLKVRHELGAETVLEHRCTASIGVALFSKHEAGQDDIIKRADTAMYMAKAAGTDVIRFYGQRSARTDD